MYIAINLNHFWKKKKKMKEKKEKKSKKDMKFEKLMIATEGAWAPRVRRRIIPKITIMKPIPNAQRLPFLFFTLRSA